MPNQSSNSNRMKVGRTVTYIGADRKRKPAIIVGIAEDNEPILRIGRTVPTTVSVFPSATRYPAEDLEPQYQYSKYGSASDGVARRESRTDEEVWST